VIRLAMSVRTGLRDDDSVLPGPAGGPDSALGDFCFRLRRIHREAGGPAVRWLANSPEISLRKTQIYAILGGQSKEPPPWEFIRVFLAACEGYARRYGRLLSFSTDPEIWRRDLDLLIELHRRTQADQLERRAGRWHLPGRGRAGSGIMG
jgi:hypothetical protein